MPDEGKAFGKATSVKNLSQFIYLYPIVGVLKSLLHKVTIMMMSFLILVYSLPRMNAATSIGVMYTGAWQHCYNIELVLLFCSKGVPTIKKEADIDRVKDTTALHVHTGLGYKVQHTCQSGVMKLKQQQQKKTWKVYHENSD